MTISEMIEELQKIKDKEGDIEVFYDDEMYGAGNITVKNSNISYANEYFDSFSETQTEKNNIKVLMFW